MSGSKRCCIQQITQRCPLEKLSSHHCFPCSPSRTDLSTDPPRGIMFGAYTRRGSGVTTTTTDSVGVSLLPLVHEAIRLWVSHPNGKYPLNQCFLTVTAP
eukprot:123288-Amphidinium_carterae.4